MPLLLQRDTKPQTWAQGYYAKRLQINMVHRDLANFCAFYLDSSTTDTL